MRLIYNNTEYSLKNGVSLLKTIYQEKYDTIPEKCKHPDILKLWKKTKSCPYNLYVMTLSSDEETKNLAIIMLNKLKIPYSIKRYWENGTYVNKISLYAAN